MPPDNNLPGLGGKLPLIPGLGGAQGAKLLVKGLTDARKRPETIQRLIDIGEPALPHLIDALGHRSRHVRDAAAFTLGRIGDKRAVMPLVGALGDGEAGVRKVAAYALGSLEDVRALPALIRLLRDVDEQVVSAAVYALGRIDLPPKLEEIMLTWPPDQP